MSFVLKYIIRVNVLHRIHFWEKKNCMVIFIYFIFIPLKTIYSNDQQNIKEKKNKHLRALTHQPYLQTSTT